MKKFSNYCNLLLQESKLSKGLDILFKENPKFSQKALENFAKENKLDSERLMAEIYKYAVKYSKFMNEGLAAKHSFSLSEADPKQVSMGIKVEAEHTDDIDIQRHIAADHLYEDPKYYSKLAKIE